MSYELIRNSARRTFESIERLYREDREEEAVMRIDGVLGMPRGVDAAVEHLKQLIAEGGPEIPSTQTVAASDPAKVGARLTLRGGAGLVSALLKLRGKCFSAILDRLNYAGRRDFADLTRENADILIAIYPTQADFLILAAQSRFILGDVDNAITLGETALHLEPGNQVVQTSLAIFRRGHNQISYADLTRQAMEIVERELDKRPACDPRELASAASMLGESLSISSRQTKAWAALARVHFLEGDYTLALDGLAKAQRHEPWDPYVIETAMLLESLTRAEATAPANTGLGSTGFRTRAAVTTKHVELEKPLQQSAPVAPRARVRQVRVFISSTFRDMGDERDILVKRVFPELRRRCLQRGLEFIDVDLRWGVTEEQAERGEILTTCLYEIDNCRPYFIALLGERYGSVPDRLPGGLLEREAWLRNCTAKSLTEIEILHGVLNDHVASDRAFFYFRDPRYIDFVSAERKPDLLTEGPAEQEMLNRLKEEIRGSGVPVEVYPEPETVGALVLIDLWRAIEADFPEDRTPSALQREEDEQVAVASGFTQVYLERRALHDALDAHVQTPDSPLVVVGESGAGKSTLLANWSSGFSDRHPNATITIHFGGAASWQAELSMMLRRVVGNIRVQHQVSQEPPTDQAEFLDALPEWLGLSSAEGPCVIVVDGIGLADEKDGFAALMNLMENRLAGARLVLSLEPGADAEECARRGWRTLRIPPLDLEERERMATLFLRLFGKSLDAVQVKLLVSHRGTSSPLFLRTVISEIRVFGSYETLGDHLGSLLQATSTVELYEQVLARWERDHAEPRIDLVRDALSLLWASRSGIGEIELLKLLGTEERHLSFGIWSPLLLSAGGALRRRRSRVLLADPFLREAIASRYLHSSEQRRSIHLRLATAFEARTPHGGRQESQLQQMSQEEAERRLENMLDPLRYAFELNESNAPDRNAAASRWLDSDQIQAQAMEELPWQLQQAGELERLVNLLTDLDYCQAMVQEGLWSELVRSWEGVGNRFDIAAAYLESLRRRRRSGASEELVSNAFSVVASLLTWSEHWREVVVTRAIRAASGILKEYGKDFKELPLNEDFAAFDRDQVGPCLSGQNQDPVHIAAVVMQAHLHFESGQEWREFVDTCSRVLCDLGDEAFYKQGSMEKARTSFELAAGLNPDREAALWGVVTVCRQGSPRRSQEAIPYAALVARLNPAHDEIINILREATD